MAAALVARATFVAKVMLRALRLAMADRKLEAQMKEAKAYNDLYDYFESRYNK